MESSRANFTFYAGKKLSYLISYKWLVSLLPKNILGGVFLGLHITGPQSPDWE
jgi:hypothetical protein